MPTFQVKSSSNRKYKDMTALQTLFRGLSGYSIEQLELTGTPESGRLHVKHTDGKFQVYFVGNMLVVFFPVKKDDHAFKVLLEDTFGANKVKKKTPKSRIKRAPARRDVGRLAPPPPPDDGDDSDEIGDGGAATHAPDDFDDDALNQFDDMGFDDVPNEGEDEGLKADVPPDDEDLKADVPPDDDLKRDDPEVNEQLDLLAMHGFEDVAFDPNAQYRDNIQHLRTQIFSQLRPGAEGILRYCPSTHSDLDTTGIGLLGVQGTVPEFLGEFVLEHDWLSRIPFVCTDEFVLMESRQWTSRDIQRVLQASGVSLRAVVTTDLDTLLSAGNVAERFAEYQAARREIHDLTWENIQGDATWWPRFERFLNETFAFENVTFYRRITTPSLTIPELEQLYADYVDDGTAMYEINLGYAQRKKMKTLFEMHQQHQALPAGTAIPAPPPPGSEALKALKMERYRRGDDPEAYYARQLQQSDFNDARDEVLKLLRTDKIKDFRDLLFKELTEQFGLR